MVPCPLSLLLPFKKGIFPRRSRCFGIFTFQCKIRGYYNHAIIRRGRINRNKAPLYIPVGSNTTTYEVQGVASRLVLHPSYCLYRNTRRRLRIAGRRMQVYGDKTQDTSPSHKYSARATSLLGWRSPKEEHWTDGTGRHWTGKNTYGLAPAKRIGKLIAVYVKRAHN